MVGSSQDVPGMMVPGLKLLFSVFKVYRFRRAVVIEKIGFLGVV